jgi:thiamine pyrophosphokinase
VGDGDSSNPEGLDKKWNSEKDASDFEMFLTEFGPRFKENLWRITGLFGGRPDHSYFNFQALCRGTFTRPVFLDGEGYFGLFLRPGEEHVLPVDAGVTFSLLWSVEPKNLTLRGCAFPIELFENRPREGPAYASLFLSNRTLAEPIRLFFESPQGLLALFPLVS